MVVANGGTEHSQKPTVIWPQAFMARALDPVEVYRVQVLAKQLGTQVASVDRPGVRYDPDAKESPNSHPIMLSMGAVAVFANKLMPRLPDMA